MTSASLFFSTPIEATPSREGQSSVFGDWIYQTADTVLSHWVKVPASAGGAMFSLDEFHETLGQVVRLARHREGGVSAAAFAARLSFHLDKNIRPSHVARLERRCDADLNRMQVIASVLGFTPSVLVITAETALGMGRPAKAAALIEELLAALRLQLAQPHVGRMAEEADAMRTWLQAADHANPNLLAESVGAAVRTLRIRRGLSARRLTDCLREQFHAVLTGASLGQIENGNVPLPWNRLAQIAAVLDVSIGEIFIEAERQSLRVDMPLKEQMDQLHELSQRAQAAPPGDAELAALADLAAHVLTARKGIDGFFRRRATATRTRLEMPKRT